MPRTAKEYEHPWQRPTPSPALANLQGRPFREYYGRPTVDAAPDILEERRRALRGAFAKHYGGPILGMVKGETTARKWLEEAKRCHQAYRDVLDSIARRLSPNTDELDYFRAFHADYVETYPDMDPNDRKELDLFLERAEKRLRRHDATP